MTNYGDNMKLYTGVSRQRLLFNTKAKFSFSSQQKTKNKTKTTT